MARSLTDPIMHGVGTMLVCFALWDERRKAGRFVLNWRVAAASLHSMFDSTLRLQGESSSVGVLAWPASVVTFGFVLWLAGGTVRKTREAMDAEREPSASPVRPTP